MEVSTLSKRNYRAFMWHAIFLSITITFTEVNSVIPAMILHVGGREIHIGIVSAIMIGVPLVSKLLFSGFLFRQEKKKPFLIAGIYLRILSLGLIALTLWNIRNFTVTGLLLLIYGELLLFTLGGAFAGTSYIDLVGKSFGPDLRKRFFTRKQILASFGILLSAVLARQFLNVFSFPYNYFSLFLAASTVLVVASAGFWFIQEEPTKGVEGKKRMGYVDTLKQIPVLLKADPTLRTYVGFLNTVGFHVALTPFYVAFAKEMYYLDPALAGNLLFIQIVGMVAASFLWPRLVKKRGFKGVLKLWAVLSGVLPLTALGVGHFLPLPFYLVLFLGTGMTIGARMVSADAAVVEISTEENRVLYTGIVGTLSLSIALFPIALGGLIRGLGYTPIFIGVSVLGFLGRFILNRMVCPIDIEIKGDLLS